MPFLRGNLTHNQRCIGKQRSPAMPIKLSNGDHGEILVKGLATFLG